MKEVEVGNKESFSIYSEGELVGFLIEVKTKNTHRFLQCDRKSDGIRVWLNFADFSTNNNPTTLGMMLTHEEARNLGLSLIEQAYELEKQLDKSSDS